AAFERHHRHLQRGEAAVVDHLLIHPAGLAAQHAGARLLGRHHRAHQRCVVHALQPKRVTTAIAYGDADSPAVGAGFGLGRRGDALHVIQGQGLDVLHVLFPCLFRDVPAQVMRMARKSLTLVRVGPVTSESPSASKKPWPSLSSSLSRARMPFAQARDSVSGATKAPAISSRPSTPSVSPATAWTPGVPSSASASDSRNSTLRP